MLAGAHRSWSGIGTVEAQAGDCIMTNPGEMHDGAPVGANGRARRMLYFDAALVGDIAERENLKRAELTRPISGGAPVAVPQFRSRRPLHLPAK